MNNSFPFKPRGPLWDFVHRQKQQADLIKRALGPAADLQERLAALQRPLMHLKSIGVPSILTPQNGLERLTRGSGLSHATLHSQNMKAVRRLTTPQSVLELQRTALAVSRLHLVPESAAQRIAKPAETSAHRFPHVLDGRNSATLAAVMQASNWTARFKATSLQLTPHLTLLRSLTEQARLIDGLTLRASAEALTVSATAVAAEQVLEANRLIEALGKPDSAEQGATLLAQLLSLMAMILGRFGENTAREFSQVGGIKLFELFLVVIAFLQWMNPPGMSEAEKQTVAAMHAEVTQIEKQIEQLLQAHEEANEAYVADLARAELKRPAPIRLQPNAKSAILLRGAKHMPLAVKQTQGAWNHVVYRDPLSDQLSEGWVNARAVAMLSQTADADTSG